MIKCLFVSLFLFLVVQARCYAAIKINELYPAPSGTAPEWVELYNDASSSATFTGYSLTDLANNLITLPSGTIPAYSFVIATSSSVLNNDGDTAILKDNLNVVLDIISYTGTFTSTKSYARCMDGGPSWVTTTTITKALSNAPACASPTTTPTPTPTSTPIPTVTPTPTPTPLPITPPTPTAQPSYENIFLSEVMVNPGPDQGEWVELHNENNFSVDLQNWYIDDLENAGGFPKNFSLSISPYGYGVIELTSAMFNNDGDTVRLLDSYKNLKSSFIYSSSVQNETWGKDPTEGTSFCLQKPSKELPNTACISPTPTPTLTPTPIRALSQPILYREKQHIAITMTPSQNAPQKKSREIISQHPVSQTSTKLPHKSLVLGTSTHTSPPFTKQLAIFSLLTSGGLVLKLYFKIKAFS